MTGAVCCAGEEVAVGVPVDPSVKPPDVDFDSLMSMLRPEPTGNRHCSHP